MLQSLASETVVTGLLDLVYRVAIAIVILLIGGRLVKLLGKFLDRVLEKPQLDISLKKFLITVLTAAANVLMLFIAAESFGIPSASIIALLGSATLAIGLALQGSLANFAGGILILVMKPFKVGDYIVGQGTEGTVEDIGIVYTTLKSVDNKSITIPNGTLSNSVVTNVTSQEKRRLDTMIGISYTSDIRLAKQIIEKIYRRCEFVLQEEDVVVFVNELADSAVIIGGRGWTKTEDYFNAKWEIVEAIKDEFDQAGIEIPFNQLDVRIRNE